MSDGAEKAVHGEKADHWKELKIQSWHIAFWNLLSQWTEG